MGWTFTHKDMFLTPSGFLINEFTSEKCKVLKCRIVGHEAYLACQVGEKVFALVVLWKEKKNDFYGFGYKAMDETVHPYYYNCPKSILNILTPTEHEDSKNWREACLERIEHKKKINKLKEGVTIKFERSFTFTGYGSDDTFQVFDIRKNHYKAVNLNLHVKLTRRTVNETKFEIVEVPNETKNS